MNQKFKVGDKVRALKNTQYSVTNAETGWEGVVTEVCGDDFCAKTTKCSSCFVPPDRMFYCLQSKFFEKIEDETPVIVEHLIRGNKTIIKLSNGKVGIAKCSPEDEFDVATGAAVALDRAYGKKVSVNPTISEEKPKDKTYREVKREAKPGEYIKIVDPVFSFEKVGDILKVSGENGGVRAVDYPKERGVKEPVGCKYWFHLSDEYVVLYGYEPPVEENPKDAGPVFKVGQLVQVKEWDEMAKEYGVARSGWIDRPICFNPEMKCLCGEFAEITKIIGDEVELRFFNVCKQPHWTFCTYMIKPVKGNDGGGRK